ncbi:MAG TPA: betaine/proline/choline family ABC transporter ATP-binding protein [Stackebrandtia sp.]|uniref:betaine/proline/choline family ABC transporter ATP-binding protein n=1 Tax=Stackebrandtia sp. TaxID=2023065 RepID=UPI002D62261B|nr:betaine/proline/choline family ABC transporter ATP-binding protein [Stackebrandtia sp.]HZE40980.1 betaine/proline/choline family ABC transporter ATP-binding protein [Stackebrandtia sp.]
MSDTNSNGGSGNGSGAQIELRNVTKRYAGQKIAAVDNVNLTIPAGEIVMFVGPSGCGKTTTMRMINRLIEPTDGEILIGGEDVRKKDPNELRRHIGYVIQAGGLFPHMTVADNIALVPKMLGWTASKIAERVREMLALVGLEPGQFANRYPRQLSGGQQQRVGVARALAADPPVLLMDEPFGAVDPITRAHLQDELLSLQDELSKTIVFVTHDFDEAVKLGDRIVILAEGSKIVQYDEPGAILANPADDFVRGFIGEGGAMKLLNVTRLADIELANVASAGPGDTAAQVLEKVNNSEVPWAVVLDDSKRPVRWITAETLAEIDGPIGDHSNADNGDHNAQITISGRSTVQEALEALLKADQNVVPVTVRRRYVGSVTLNVVQNAINQLRDKAKAGGRK